MNNDALNNDALDNDAVPGHGGPNRIDPSRTGPRTDQPAGNGRGFEDGEVLRALLVRLHLGGKEAWASDPQAGALMAHVARKYAPLAHRHGLDPWEAASAAFEVMRARATRVADNPWAVITRAVQVTCIAEERAHGLLCSPHQARRTKFAGFHDAQRFADHDTPVSEYHHAFHIDPFNTDTDVDDVVGCAGKVTARDVPTAITDTIVLFTVLGWDAGTAGVAIDYVADRLSQVGSRRSAFDVLRKDRHARALLDIPRHAWIGLLRVVLGSPDPNLAATNTGRGVLLRLLIGVPLEALLGEDDVARAIETANPHRRGTYCGGGW